MPRRRRYDLLLVANPHTELASVEDEVAHEASGAVLGPDTLVDGAGIGGHLEADVLQRGSLRDLPVDTRRTIGGRHLARVDDEVADRAEATRASVQEHIERS